jgi:hypothetical protein
VEKPFYPTDDFELDMDYLTRFYSKINGKNPELGIGK